MASGRTEYLNDPEAPKPNSLVPAANDEASAVGWYDPRWVPRTALRLCGAPSLLVRRG